jgi:CheY-like chemotaxis protein
MIQTVLIADAEDGSREEAAWCLLAHGYRALTARTGVETLAALTTKKVQLLVIDPGMSDGGGCAVLRYVSRDPRLSHMPVLVLAKPAWGNAPSDAVLRELAALPKPFTSEQLFQMVTSIIGQPYQPRRRATTPAAMLAEAFLSSPGQKTGDRP